MIYIIGQGIIKKSSTLVLEYDVHHRISKAFIGTLF